MLLLQSGGCGWTMNRKGFREKASWTAWVLGVGEGSLLAEEPLPTVPP